MKLYVLKKSIRKYFSEEIRDQAKPLHEWQELNIEYEALCGEIKVSVSLEKLTEDITENLTFESYYNSCNFNLRVSIENLSIGTSLNTHKKLCKKVSKVITEYIKKESK